MMEFVEFIVAEFVKANAITSDPKVGIVVRVNSDIYEVITFINSFGSRYEIISVVFFPRVILVDR